MSCPCVSVALLGVGLFSKDVYGKLILGQQGCDLRAVWSRSQHSAEEFVSGFAPAAEACFGEAGLQHILDDSSIVAVIVVLPVQVALEVVQRCLAAGKHVMQEKPVAATSQLAATAIAHHSANGRSLWFFAENYRFEGVFLAARELVASLGAVVKLDLVADLPMDARNKYFSSGWRRDTAGCPGGFLMDSAVHSIAALRLVAGACGAGDATSASGLTAHAAGGLSDPDSVVGVVRFGSSPGVPASVSISLASDHVRWSLVVVGTRGTAEISRGGWAGSRAEYALTFKRSSDPAPVVQRHPFSGMGTELAEFLRLVHVFEAGGAAAVAADDAGQRSSPREGLLDLSLMEALLSGDPGGGARLLGVH
ncbi:MAG: hypothetical protein WDW36_008489 [Sanguina aurantia]